MLRKIINICYLPGGRSVWEKNCARGLQYSVLKTKGTVVLHTDRPSSVNNIFIFFVFLFFKVGKQIIGAIWFKVSSYG